MTFELVVDTEDTLMSAETIAEAVRYQLASNYSDGRRPLNAELAHGSIASLAHGAINGALFHAVHDQMFPGGNPKTKRDFKRRDREIERRAKLVARVEIVEDNTVCTPADPKARCHVCGADSFDADTWCVPCGAATCELL